MVWQLLSSPEGSDGISMVMSLLRQYYVQFLNATLWEGRHKACIVNTNEYLLSCYRYIEFNPVRAGMVETPDIYPRISYRYHVWGKKNLDSGPYTLYGTEPDRRGASVRLSGIISRRSVRQSNTYYTASFSL